jgi:hypothetical protein
MSRYSLTALLAGFLLVCAAGARAIPFCDRFPDSPICDHDDPPEPCELDPGSCEPDPCELDPGSCEPDPCEVDPGSCEPDPCELDPASCEPEPEPLEQWAGLAGTGVVKGEGFRERSEPSMDLYFGAEAFMLVPRSCTFLTGNLVPKGTKGSKFQLFLDDPSKSAYTSFVAELAAAARGRVAAHVLGENTKLILKLRHDGSAVLKIKSQVLLQGVDEVVFKANLSGPVGTAAARPSGEARCP